MLFLSPRNSLEGQLSLIDARNCKVFLTSATCPPLVQAIIDARSLRHVNVPFLENLLDGPRPRSRAPSLLSFEEIRYDPLAYLHSSGSTGLPKLIGWSFGCVSGHFAQLDFQNCAGDKTLMQRLAQGGKNFLNCFPMFHAGGLWFALAHELGLRIILPPAGQLVNADMVASILQMSAVDTACVPPAILEDMSKKPEWRASLKNLKYILTGGAPLPKAVGDVLQSCGPRIWNVHASTEAGFIPTLDVAKEDWLYSRFAPGFGLELRPHSDDLYELVIVRDEQIVDMQMVFQNYPELHEYPTQDLFRRHSDPTKADLWLSCGRHDDVIVLSNGEKFNPRLMENTIQSHSLVSKALVFGRERFQSAVLIELHDMSEMNSIHDHEHMINQIWSVIEQANTQAPSHGKISRSLVAFTKRSKPMTRTPKGSVARNATYELYADEMSALYARFEGTTMNGFYETEDAMDVSKICSLQRLVQCISPAMPKILGETDNLFTLGFDSLQALQLVREIKQRSPSTIIEARTIYNNPTLKALSRALRSPNLPTSNILTNREKAVDILIAKHSSPLYKPHLVSTKVVLLTGATGSLGSHVLKKLLTSAQYTHIYCLVRTPPTLTSHCDRHITYLQTSLSDPQLGLDYDTYSHILRTVTHVIHNAWTVNFNLPLSAFEEHVLGVRHLIDFCLRSSCKAQILFVSSIAAVLNARDDPVPERAYADASVAESSGYGESKHVAERLLGIVGKREGLQYKIVRVGQIAGPVREKGVWNPVEWVPSLIQSSRFLKCLPESLGAADSVDWMPVDTVAQIMVDILGVEEEDKSERVYHVQNPRHAVWKDLVPAIRTRIGGEKVELVSFARWTERLKERAGDQDAGMDLPALRLLDFFERLSKGEGKKIATLDVKNTVMVSPVLAGVGPVTQEMMALWMERWGF